MSTTTPRRRPAQRISYSFQRILTGSDLSRRRLPVMSAIGNRKGPVVWLTACAHGDEVGGMAVIQEVFRRLRRHPLRCGALHAYPLLNPLGFEVGQRHISLSEEDLNRSFPGDADGTLAERIAAHIFEHILSTRPDAVLDLHNDWIRSIPYAVLDAPSGLPAAARRRVKAMALDTGLTVVTETSPMHGSLSHALMSKGIAALTLELGESLAVVEANVAVGLDAIWNVLTAIGLTDTVQSAVPTETQPRARRTVLAYSSRPFASTSGIIRFAVQPGVIVTAGQTVARIYNTFGKLQETIHAPADAVVLGRSDSSVAYPGAPILAFGILP